MELTALGQPEALTDERQLRSEGAPPPLRVDLELAPADLPAVAHARIEQGLVAPAERGRTGDGAQLSRGGGGNREADGADPLDLDVQILAAAPELRCERAFRLDGGERRGDLLQQTSLQVGVSCQGRIPRPQTLRISKWTVHQRNGALHQKNGASGPRGFAE
ncbi:hypothetical protein WME73_10875 [Sorangium sp. So ce302]|uniref:hypothetical protein n=1 Tax=Sorangium sp. So ce302 TaxID=3133297 RepID=UPI003F5D8AAF